MEPLPQQSRKRKKVADVVESSSPKHKQLRMDSFVSRSNSTPLSNISNAVRSRENISLKTSKSSSSSQTDEDDCKIVEPESGKAVLKKNELQKAAEYVVGSYYSKLNSSTGRADRADVEVLGDKPSCYHSQTYDLLFTKEVANERKMFALLLLSSICNSKSYLHAEIMHKLLKEIIPEIKSSADLMKALELVHSTLEMQPPWKRNMRGYYWDILPRKFADPDPMSRWEMLRNLLENLEQKNNFSDQILDLDADSPELETDEALLDFYITLLEKDFRSWNPGQSKHRPLVAKIFWPFQSEIVGQFNQFCRELVTLHKNALVNGNVKLFTMSTRLIDLIVEVSWRSERPLTDKIRVPGPKFREFVRKMSEIFTSLKAEKDLRLLLSTLQNRFLVLELSRALLMYHEDKVPKSLTLKDILEVYLKFSKFQTANEMLEAYEKLNTKAKICLVSLVDSYLDCFHVRRLNQFFCASKRTAGFEGGPQGSEVFSASYTYNQFEKDFRVLQYLLKLCKGSAVLKKILHA